MLDITCAECGKKYRVDETKMKGTRAKVKCKACSNVMVVTKPQAEASAEPSISVGNDQPPPTADIFELPLHQSESVPPSVVEGPGDPAKDKPAEPDKDVSAVISGQKIRFGLFGKIFIVMLIASLLPLAVFWGITLRETKEVFEVFEVFESFNQVPEFALILLAGTVLLVLVIAWVSARAIVSPIRKLTDTAERMSLGELNVKIDIKSKDEIGLLAQSIVRMQTSLRLAMNRLRRKR